MVHVKIVSISCFVWWSFFYCLLTVSSSRRCGLHITARSFASKYYAVFISIFFLTCLTFLFCNLMRNITPCAWFLKVLFVSSSSSTENRLEFSYKLNYVCPQAVNLHFFGELMPPKLCWKVLLIYLYNLSTISLQSFQISLFEIWQSVAHFWNPIRGVIALTKYLVKFDDRKHKTTILDIWRKRQAFWLKSSEVGLLFSANFIAWCNKLLDYNHSTQKYVKYLSVHYKIETVNKLFEIVCNSTLFYC